MIIHYYSPRAISFLHWPNKHVEWERGRNHQTYILQFLDGGTNLCSPSRNTIFLWFTFFFFPWRIGICFTVLKATSLRSMYWQSRAPSKGTREESFSGLPPFFQCVGGNLWCSLAYGSKTPVFTGVSLCVWLCVHISPSYDDTSQSRGSPNPL